ncbi:unnamed protein product [Echinostoma caproni]|uniref:G_PROTEIN_RECEP_F1_2 domain-containing protein n=1 Tax=Echinostoma caproni TaxID=27848 RepID=A0A183AM87_9TREM|nr:unnamed protein product [Echinostoma caproni]
MAMQYPLNTVQPQPVPGQPQPLGTAQTTVVITTQPGPVPVLTPLKNWTWRLFDIPDCGLFAMSWFCPCLVFGATAQAIGQSYVLCCVAYVFTLLNVYLVPIHILLGCFFRERVRNRYRIRGNLLCDLLAYVFCCPCTLNQEALQADAEQRALAAVPGGQGSNGFSIRLGSRVISLNTDRAAQSTTTVPTATAATTVPGPSVPLLAPTMPYASTDPSVQQPMMPSVPPPYTVSQQLPLGFAVSQTAPAHI